MTAPRFFQNRILWIASASVLSFLMLLPVRLAAQSQDSQSVAEAARKAKEKKKTAPRDNQVITDDTIGLRPASADSGAAPPSGTVINTTPVMPGGATPAAPADAIAAPPAEPAKSAESPVTDVAAPGPTDAKKAEEQAAEIVKLKESLKQLQSELDLLKRKFALDSESFYSEPDYIHDSDGKARLDDLQRQMGDKQLSLDDLKQKLEQLMQEAGVSSDAVDKSSAPPQN